MIHSRRHRSCLPCGLRRRHLLIGAVVIFFIWAFSRAGSPPIDLSETIQRTFHGIKNSGEPGESLPNNGYDFVDPLIGTINGGHVFPGASRPFSMAKAGPDVDSQGENQGGFVSDGSKVYGFSHMHDSGTGGSPSLGNFPIFVYPECSGHGDLDGKEGRCDWDSAVRGEKVVEGSVKARPGYFALELESGVKAEITVGNKSAIYRFRISEDARERARRRWKGGKGKRGDVPTGLQDGEKDEGPYTIVLLDGRDLSNTGHNLRTSASLGTGRMTGAGGYYPSFGEGTYEAFSCVEIKDINKMKFGVGGKGGSYAYVKLPVDIPEIIVRVGISFKTIDTACDNAVFEIPDFDFDSTLHSAESAWKSLLGNVRVKPGNGVSKELQTVFWSGLYRSLLSPQDYTGENPLWFSDEPYYDSYYCIWDSFRSIHPLITLVDPKSQIRMIRSLVDIYKNVGKLPDCRMSLCKGFTQGGSNADVVIADAYVKGLRQDINWDLAYEAVVSDAEIEPENWNVEGRGGLKPWKEIGYIPYMDNSDNSNTGMRTRSVSRTVEYAYNDFCISLMATGMGKHSDAKKYFQRSTNWKNLWRSDQKSYIDRVDTGFTGFLQPRWANGSWAYQDPLRCSLLLWFHSCYLEASGGESYEGTMWMYGFYVPQDHKSLIKTLGGREEFVRRLDYLHETPGVLYIGDEQAFLPVFQYHYAGAPYKSSDKAHFYIPNQFNASINGIPGNDDSGGMGSFAVLTMMGTWPVPGQDVYLITPPFFEEVRVRNDITGKWARIVNKNFDPTYKRRYVRRAWMNGRRYYRNWFQHKFWTEGGTLELELTETPGEWGTKEEDVPPSYSPP